MQSIDPDTMMKKYLLFVVAFVVAALPVAAQEKLLTVDDIFSPDPKVRVNFSGTPARLTWAADGRSFRQFQDGKLVRVDAATGNVTQFYDADRFAAALAAVAGVKPEDAARMANSPTLQFNESETAILVNHSNDLWHYDVAGGVLKRLTNSKDEEKEPDYSPDGKYVSFVRKNDLFVVEVARAREKQGAMAFRVRCRHSGRDRDRVAVRIL